MPRPRYPRRQEPLPPPLPPAERTVGQLVAETLRLYGRRFWPALALGVPVAVANLVAAELAGAAALVFLPAWALLPAAALVGATVIAADADPGRDRLLRAAAAAFMVFLPFPLLALVFVLPALIWLAAVGLSVPVIVIEGLGLRASFPRAFALARADFVHALGGLATFAILVFITQYALFLALSAQGEQTARVAAFLAGAVVSPILFLGVALLYFDQAARLTRRESARAARRGSARREG